MFLARVIGSVVSTKKEETMRGRPLLLLRPMLVDESDPAQLKPGTSTIVAVDGLGAGTGDLVLFCQGSSARQTTGMKQMPIDAAIIGLVDTVEVLGKRIV
jgi:ethanolamine utilization protein EutN